MNLSQEELAEKIYVTRQTISNWENDKSYPDIHSLLLLSSTFHISLDQLIKGDITTMKEEISKEAIQKFNRDGAIFTVLLILTVIAAVPLAVFLGYCGYIVWGILFLIMIYYALRVEKFKKENDIMTYKEIVAFTEGKQLDEIEKAQEKGKRPYQQLLSALGGALSIIIGLIGITNFVNSVLTSIITRRKELAMLQSIGMTGKQLKKMLSFEGLYYAAGTVVASIVFGSLVSVIIVRAISNSIWFFTYKFVIFPMFVIYPFLIALTVIIPAIIYRKIAKTSIIERLHQN